MREKLNIIPFEPHHSLDLIKRGDVVENVKMREESEGIANFLSRSSIAYTLRAGNKVIVCGGISIVEEAGIGVGWLVCSSLISSFPKSAIRTVRIVFDAIREEIKKRGVRLIAVEVEKGNKKFGKVAEVMGFKDTGKETFNERTGKTFSVFSMEVM